MKTKLEIINETIEYYSEDTTRRATVDGVCRYLTNNGHMCAVGRCMESPNQNMRGSVYGIYDPFSRNGKILEIETLLKTEYKGHPIEFWDDLQKFHDESINWDDNGMTIRGIFESKYLMSKWGDIRQTK